MKSNNLIKIIALTLLIPAFVMMCLSGCEKDKDDPPKDDPPADPPFPTEEITGSLGLTPGATINASDLTAVSFAGSDQLSETGGFVINIPESDMFQAIFFNNNDDDPVYIGIYNPAGGIITANETSTAQALTMFNPYLIFSDQSEREAFLNSVQNNSKFSQLVSALTEAYQTDAFNALNYEQNPNVYQLAAQIVKETLESYGYDKSTEVLGDPPYIEDASGPNVTFVNNRFVWYAAGVYPDYNTLDEVVPMNRRENVVSFNWGWPPVVQTEPAETNYDLGDGNFKIYMAKGFDFTEFGNWDDPMGMATTMNTAQSMLYVMDVILGFMPMPDMMTFPNHVSISVDEALDLYNKAAAGDVQGFLVSFFMMMNDNGDDIAKWLYEGGKNEAAEHFIQTASGLLSNVALVFKILGLANEQAPFFYDLAFAPMDVTYFITQQGGTIISNTQNNAPQAEYTVDPPAGVVGTVFNFDASQTTDDETPLSQMQFRWDFEGDGSWTSWSADPVASYTYGSTGSYNVLMQAKDADDLIGVVVHTVNVGGGAGSANHIKLFMDELPWDSDAMQVMLQDLGFTEGTGENTYEIITSSEMSSVSLIPGEDLVIISNDQPQTFYANYAANQAKFTNFVYTGGSLFWEACDEGWNYGSMADAGVILPGNIAINLNFDYYNYVVNPTLPLVAGLPTEMDHNYASHEYFSNIPDGTIVYCEDSGGGPTLIEVSLGGGWTILSGQPLEHQYENVYGNDDMAELLPRIVSYFTGKTITLRDHSPKPSERASHLD